MHVNHLAAGSWILFTVLLVFLSLSVRRFLSVFPITPGPKGWGVWFLLCVSTLVGVGIIVGGILRTVSVASFSVALLAVIAAIRISAWRLRRPATARYLGLADLKPLWPSSWALRGLLILAVMECAWILLLCLLFPVFEYDSLRYHIASAACWISQGYIGPVATPSTFINTLPKNAEVLQLWMMLLGGSDRLVDLYQLPFWIAGCISVFNLALYVGASRNMSVFSALLTFFTPMALCQCTTTYVDIVSAGSFLVALDLIASALDSREARGRYAWLALAGLASGLMLGTKSDALPRVLLFAVFLVFAIPDRPKHRVTGTAVFLGAAILLGCYWYLQNWILYGSPVYPLSVSFGDRTILPGEMGPREFYAGRGVSFGMFWSSLLDWTGAYTYDSGLAGYGPALICLFLPAACVRLFTLRGAPRKGFVLFLWILMVAIPVTNPMRNPRFNLFLPGVGGVILASLFPTLSYLTRRIVAAIGVAVIVFVVFSTLGQGHYAASEIRYALAKGPKRPQEFLWGVDYKWALSKDPSGRAIAYAGDHLVYYFFGPHLRNRVVYVLPTDEEEWLDGIRKENVGRLWIGRIGNYEFHRIEATREIEWVKAHPEVFEKTLENFAGTLYLVKRTEP